jgi:hypothetical protein
MQCPQSADHPAVAACRAAKSISHGIDRKHICNLKTCRFWNTPFDRKLFVCTTGLHLHRCQNDSTCELAVETGTSGTFTCPISGIEMKEQSMTHDSVVKIKSRYGHERWGSRYSYSLKVSKARHASKLQIAHRQMKQRQNLKRKQASNFTRAATATLLLKIAQAAPPQNKIIARTLKMVNQSLPFTSIIDYITKATSIYKPTTPCPAHIELSVARHAAAIIDHLTPTPTVYVLIATIASLLATGLEAQGVVVYPKLEWFATNMPPLTMYARVENIQCRNMSACTRAIKAATFRNQGIAASLVFRTLT